jgi:hypothetical protein
MLVNFQQTTQHHHTDYDIFLQKNVM